MKISGHIKKMRVKIGNPVEYQLPLDDQDLAINASIGKQIQLDWSGIIHCLACGKKTKKSFNQGYCYPCFRRVPECSECIIKPELCRGHLGEGRDLEWEKENHVQDHFVYLAVSSAVKVGVTRATQIPTRWIDQGASQAIKIAKTPNRYLAGQIEVALKELFTDKTDWRKMLSNKILERFEPDTYQKRIAEHLKMELQQYLVNDSEVVSINYPVNSYPAKVTSIGFDKQKNISATLNGIKGQYLLLDKNRVINMRKHAGYLIDFTII